jgi:hypothetical protein
MINLKTRIASVSLAVIIVSIAACNSESSLTPNVTSQLDVAAVISQMSTGTLAGIPGAGVALGVPATTAAPTIVPSACTYSSASQGFVCPSIASTGLTFNATYWLYDAAGHSQTQPNTSTTASIRAVVDASGTVSAVLGQASASTTVANHSDLTMSGLLGNTRTLNGTSTGHDSVTGTGSTTTIAVIDLTTVANSIVVPASEGDGSSWPLSGTLTVDANTVTKTGGLSVTASAHAVVTFNGTSLVNVSGTVAGIPTTCRIDLSGKVAPVCV